MAVRENGEWRPPVPERMGYSHLFPKTYKLFRLAGEVQGIIDEYPGLAFEPVLVRVVEALTR